MHAHWPPPKAVELPCLRAFSKSGATGLKAPWPRRRAGRGTADTTALGKAVFRDTWELVVDIKLSYLSLDNSGVCSMPRASSGMELLVAQSVNRHLIIHPLSPPSFAYLTIWELTFQINYFNLNLCFEASFWKNSPHKHQKAETVLELCLLRFLFCLLKYSWFTMLC